MSRAAEGERKSARRTARSAGRRERKAERMAERMARKGLGHADAAASSGNRVARTWCTGRESREELRSESQRKFGPARNAPSWIKNSQ